MLKSFPFHPSSPQLKPMNNTSSFRYIPFWSCPWIVMRFWSYHLDVIIQLFDLHWLTPSCFRLMPSISSVRTAPIYLKAHIEEESIRLREKKDAGEKSNHKHLHVLHSTVSICSVCVCWGFSRPQKWCTKKSKFLSKAVDCSWTPEEVAVLGDVNGQEAVLEGRSGTGLGAQVCWRLRSLGWYLRMQIWRKTWESRKKKVQIQSFLVKC